MGRMPEHMSGAGQLSEWEKSGKQVQREHSGEWAEMAAQNPLKALNWLLSWVRSIIKSN